MTFVNGECECGAIITEFNRGIFAKELCFDCEHNSTLSFEGNEDELGDLLENEIKGSDKRSKVKC